MDTTISRISCNIATSDAGARLGVEIWIDNQQIFNLEHVTELINFSYNLPDDDGEHQLKFVMKGKMAEHDDGIYSAYTDIDDDGNIVKDARLIISNLGFDEIKLGQIFIDQAVYTHDFNGSQPEIQDKFYGEMGCNGTVQLDFTTPIYLWLLEHR